MPDIDATPVSKWLVRNDAGNLKQPFFDAGYVDLEDLSDSVISDCVGKGSPDGEAAPGLVKRLSRNLPQNAAKAHRTPLPPPALPVNTPPVDLSQPQTPALPDGSTFAIPSSLPDSIAAAKFVDPLALSPADWMVVARHARLLYGWDMSGEAPRQATKPVLLWDVPASTDQFAQSRTDTAVVSTSIVFDSSSAKYVTSGFNQVTASASYAFASASVSREASWRNTSARQTQNLYMTGSWWFPRATLDLRQCTVLNPQFITDIETALGGPDPRAALEQVFFDYGHAIPLLVTVGGELFFQHLQAASSTENTSSYEEVIRAAVSVKVGGASGDVSAAAGSGSSSDLTAKSLADNTSLQARGGEVRDIEHRDAWENSVANPNMWAVIRDDALGKAHAVLDLLAATTPSGRDLAQRVRDLDRGLIGQPIPFSTTVKAMPSDGFLLGILTADTSVGPTRGILTASTDPAVNPTSVRGGASVHIEGNTHIPFGSLLTPVRRSEYAVDDFTRWSNAPVPGHDLLFVSLGPHTADTYLGAWQDGALPVNKPPASTAAPGASFTAPSDGFVVCRIGAYRFGTRGYLKLLAKDGTLLAGTSVHNYPNDGNWHFEGSFCVPLHQGDEVAVLLEPTDAPDLSHIAADDFIIAADWIPLDPTGALRFAAAETRMIWPNTATTYTATTDGLLVGSLVADGNGGQATLGISLPPSTAAPDIAPLTLGHTTVEYSAGSADGNADNWIRYNTVTVPIRAGSTYQADYRLNYRTVAATLSWIPLLPT